METGSLFTEEEYLLQLRSGIDGLRVRTGLPHYKYADKQQAKLIAHFLHRGVQLGAAAYRVRDLAIPLQIFMRVLCDDVIRLFWVAQCESNATEYINAGNSEVFKFMRSNLQKGFARIVNTRTGEDMTAMLLKELEAHVVKGRKIEQLAQVCRLQKIYEIPFRAGSLSVHGNTFVLSDTPNEKEELEALLILPAIIAALAAIARIADGFPNKGTSPDEVERIFLVNHIGRN